MHVLCVTSNGQCQNASVDVDHGGHKLVTTTQLIGEGNAKVYEGYDFGCLGGGQKLAVKIMPLPCNVDILDVLEAIKTEIELVEGLQVMRPDAPICFPIAHCEY